MRREELYLSDILEAADAKDVPELKKKIFAIVSKTSQ